MNTYGENIRITVFGESHGAAVGMVLDGIEAGVELDMDLIKSEMSRRAPGGSELATPRRETDEPAFISGVFDGKTTGAPLCAVINNGDTRSKDYKPNLPRPGHSDLTAHIKFSGHNDYRGGGHFSGRLTAAFVLAGAICRQILTGKGIEIGAKIVRVGKVTGDGLDDRMRDEILAARANGDSVGSAVECTVTGIPAGTGGLMFGSMESRIAAMLYAVPGVKGVEFGAGFAFAGMLGSEANDPIRVCEGGIRTETNNSGGINGGITNGMPLVVRAALRPTPSISLEQRTVDLIRMENATLRIEGRHDPCLAPRALPVIESCLAFCVLDALGG